MNCRTGRDQAARSARTGRAIALGLLLAASLPPAFGHAGLVSSEPGRRAQLSAPPTQIRLCFNENIEAKFSTIALLDAAGAAVPLGAPQADAETPACLIAPIDALAPGSYTVKFRVLSVDGHVVEKSYGFSLKLP